MFESGAISTSEPSVGPPFTDAAPMAPAAPARFSTTNERPVASASLPAITRAIVSIEPPGG